MYNSYHHILVDAKQEYTKQLVNMLAPCFYEGIKSIYESLSKLVKISGRNKYITG